MDEIDRVTDEYRRRTRGLLVTVLLAPLGAATVVLLCAMVDAGPLNFEETDLLPSLRAVLRGSPGLAHLVPDAPLALSGLTLTLLVATTLTRFERRGPSVEELVTTQLAGTLTVAVGMVVAVGNLTLAALTWSCVGPGAGLITAGSGLLSAALVGLGRPISVLRLRMDQHRIGLRRARLDSWRTEVRAQRLRPRAAIILWTAGTVVLSCLPLAVALARSLPGWGAAPSVLAVLAVTGAWTPYLDRELARAAAYRKAEDWVAATARTAYPSFGAFYVAGVIALTLVDRARSTRSSSS